MKINEFDNTIRYVIGDEEDLTVDISGDYTYSDGDSVTLTVRKHSSDEDPLFSEPGSIVHTINRDYAVISIISEDTKGADPGVYNYDIELVMSSAPITIVPHSKFILIPEETR